MNNVITFQLLGIPRILLNNEEQFFAFAKVNALLYYLAVNGSVSREMAASLLWENKNTQTAKKNLRNTIYQANKVLQSDVIICPNRNMLRLNPALDIQTDIARFLEAPLAHLALYQGEFLQGFTLKAVRNLTCGSQKFACSVSRSTLKLVIKKSKRGYLWMPLKILKSI